VTDPAAIVVSQAGRQHDAGLSLRRRSGSGHEMMGQHLPLPPGGCGVFASQVEGRASVVS
jgi:hypothetical protein